MIQIKASDNYITYEHETSVFHLATCLHSPGKKTKLKNQQQVPNYCHYTDGIYLPYVMMMFEYKETRNCNGDKKKKSCFGSH